MTLRTMSIVLFLLASTSAKSITIWQKERGATRKFVESALDDFNKQNKVATNFEYVYSETIKPSLIKAATLKTTLPEVVIVPSDFVGLHKLLSLSEVSPDIMDSDIPKDLVDTVRIDGKLYGVPIFSGNHLMMFYNKKFVKEPAASFEDMREQKKAFDKLGIGTLTMKYQEMYWLAPFILGHGGALINGRAVTLNHQPMIDALNDYKKLVDWKLTSGECLPDCTTADFNNGKYAYSISGEWDLGPSIEAIKEDLGVTIIPTMSGMRPRPFQSSNVLIFPGNSLKGPNGAILRKFARYMTSYNVQKRVFTEGKRHPVHKLVLNDLKSSESPVFQGSLQQLQIAIPMPNDESIAIAWEAMALGFRHFFAGKLDAKGAAAMMQQSADSVGAKK